MKKNIPDMLSEYIQELSSWLIEHWLMSIISLILAVLLFQFHYASLLDKRYITVPLTIKNEGEMVPAEHYPQKIKVLLWGDAVSIDSIVGDDITAYLDLSHLKEEGSYHLPIYTHVGGTAASLNPVEVHPEPASITVKVERGAEKNVPVILALKGIPADGYEITESTIEPPAIEIRGPVSVLETIDSLLTEVLFIEARTSGFSGSADVINHNPLVSVLGKTQIQYTVKINEVIAEKNIANIPLYFDKLNPKYKITAAQKIGSLKIHGPKKQIEQWSIPVNLLTVPCDTINEPGTYTLPVIPMLSTGNTAIQIERFYPKTVQATVFPAVEEHHIRIDGE